ncbi:MAG: hypothetical protein QXW00_02765 [Candidatus Woesearchaeota archaeon]
MFIRIGKVILDFNEYRKRVSTLKKFLSLELKSIFSNYGFEIRQLESRSSYDQLIMNMINQELEISVKIKMQRYKKENLEE